MGFLSSGDISAMTALINSQANAALTKLERPGPLAANGDPGNYVEVWTGEAPALLDRQETAVTVRATDGSTVGLQLADTQRRDTLTVLDGVAPIVEQAGPDWQAYRITIDDQRTNPSRERTFQIHDLKRDMYGLLDSITLTLDHAT